MPRLPGQPLDVGSDALNAAEAAASAMAAGTAGQASPFSRVLGSKSNRGLVGPLLGLQPLTATLSSPLGGSDACTSNLVAPAVCGTCLRRSGLRRRCATCGRPSTPDIVSGPRERTAARWPAGPAGMGRTPRRSGWRATTSAASCEALRHASRTAQSRASGGSKAHLVDDCNTDTITERSKGISNQLQIRHGVATSSADVRSRARMDSSYSLA